MGIVGPQLDDQLADAGGGAASVDLDELVAASGLAVSRVLAAIGVLEARRIARRLPGNRVTRA